MSVNDPPGFTHIGETVRDIVNGPGMTREEYGSGWAPTSLYRCDTCGTVVADTTKHVHRLRCDCKPYHVIGCPASGEDNRSVE